MAWRVRVVESLTVGSARLCSRHRSLQVAPLSIAVNDRMGVDPARQVRVLLPVELLEKRPLLDFDVTVDQRPAYLPPRATISQLEADYFSALAARQGVELTALAHDLVFAICDFTPTTWQHFALHRHRGRRSRAMARYVKEGLAASLEAGEMRRVRAAADRLAERLRVANGQYRWWSSVDEPLLAVVGLAGRCGTDADTLVQAFADLLSAADDLAGSGEDGAHALAILADYGHLWQAFVAADVPTDRPFIITTERQEPVRVSWTRGRARQALSLADAGSNHLTLGTSDENVELGHVTLLDHRSQPLGLVTGLRQSRERYAVYLSEPDRAKRGTLVFRLRAPLSISSVSTLVAAVTWVAVAVSVCLSVHCSLKPDALAVLTVPTTFAASLLLTRERNSLARRLQWKSRLVTWIGMAALWIVAAYSWVEF